jgi:hypothetical protein
MNDELRRIWKEAIMDYFKIHSYNFLTQIEENHEKFQSEWPTCNPEDHNSHFHHHENLKSQLLVLTPIPNFN